MKRGDLVGYLVGGEVVDVGIVLWTYVRDDDEVEACVRGEGDADVLWPDGEVYTHQYPNVKSLKVLNEDR